MVAKLTCCLEDGPWNVCTSPQQCQSSKKLAASREAVLSLSPKQFSMPSALHQAQESLGAA